jgi:tRNA A37 threonylcarbamoyladenosine dehydratase
MSNYGKKMTMFTSKFWSYAGERSIKTFAQAAIAFLGAGSVGLFAIDWAALISVSAGAAFLSLLTSVVSVKTDDHDESA